MDKIYIPASITLEKGFATKRYKWKSGDKESFYRRPCKRAVIRFTCKNFADKVNKINQEKRQVLIEFLDNSNAIIKRIKERGVSLQGYSGNHPYIQIIVNKSLPKELWKILEDSDKKSITLPVNVEIDLNDWGDINLSQENFILEIEKEAKSLVNKALKKGFKVIRVPKGRSHDASLVHPDGTEFIIAISSHVAKTQSRSKEKTIQKILMDISKMLPYLSENKNVVPVVITRPIEFEKSWSFTTNKYLDFYREKFGFKFLTTEFKNDWEDIIIEKLSKSKMYNQQETEEEILQFWKKNKIFDKLRKKIKGNKKWSFLDGPITANNPMGVHHAWGRTYKDVFQRFKAMQGFDQRFQNGFDCQGLWVEREEEKELGLKNKQDIEKFGILNFVKSCRKRVEKFSKIQTQQSIRLGQWMDWDNSYYTMTDDNNLHNWYLLKKYYEKKWLYKGKDAVPWCWRCGTASSKHDIVTEGYLEVTHKALFMQFPIKDKKNEYFLIFTTTPWTVPANVAIAVNEKLNYVKVKNNGKKYWLVKSRLNELRGDYKILETKKGKELKGIKYEMPFVNFKEQKNSPHKVVLWDMASEEEGTGIVHIAPGCGAEDFDLGKKENLNAISPLNEFGVYKEGFGNLSNKKYLEVNQIVLKDLDERGFVYKIEPYKHRYPHCWRCGQELVFRLVNEWYIKGNEIRSKLINENKKIKWFPKYGGVRQEEWFKNMGDWLISRKRYWGLPLPIWECKCGKVEVIGSLKELREKAVDKKKVDKLPEIHRPWIDEIKIKCKKCGNNVERIKDVGDAWLDAGITPFSTIGPYLTNKKEWEKWFPVDLISENIPGQFRGWFNALFWSSITLTGKAPFKSLFGYETLKDENGKEMHKSKGNAIWFDDAIKKIGADPMRLLYCLQDPSLELKFGYHVVKEPKNNLGILYNISKLVEDSGGIKIDKIEDKWILSKLNSLIKKVTQELEDLHPHLATRVLKDFWLNDLSRRYIQIIRERLSNEDKTAKFVLKEVYLKLIKLLAPIIPFLTEKIWQDLKKNKIVSEESIHLVNWPKQDNKLINEKLEKEFETSFQIIEKGLAERDKAKINLRWPLNKAMIIVGAPINKELQVIIASQLNVKKVDIKKISGNEISVKLDTKLTPELESEGYAREISRKVQAGRKKAGLVKTDKIKLALIVDESFRKIIENQSDMIKDRTNSDAVLISSKEEKGYKESFEEKIKDEHLKILFTKV